jgi:hypothetical protein
MAQVRLTKVRYGCPQDFSSPIRPVQRIRYAQDPGSFGRLSPDDIALIVEALEQLDWVQGARRMLEGQARKVPEALPEAVDVPGGTAGREAENLPVVQDEEPGDGGDRKRVLKEMRKDHAKSELYRMAAGKLSRHGTAATYDRRQELAGQRWEHYAASQANIADLADKAAALALRKGISYEAAAAEVGIDQSCPLPLGD